MDTNSKIIIDLPELQKAIANIANERREAAETILTEIIFLDGTLKTLKTNITKEGPVIKTKRGTTVTVKENPALKAYNTSVMRYIQLIKQLTDLLPKPEETPKTDPLIDFMKAGSK